MVRHPGNRSRRSVDDDGVDVVVEALDTVLEAVGRIELACQDPEEEKYLARLNEVKWDMLEEWSKTKRAPKQAAWMHEKELTDI